MAQGQAVDYGSGGWARESAGGHRAWRGAENLRGLDVATARELPSPGENASSAANDAGYEAGLSTSALVSEVRRLLGAERCTERLLCRYLADLADRVRAGNDLALSRFCDELDAVRTLFGLGVRETRERIRVGRALRHLPRIEEAFVAGHVSYSRVREITRVAAPTDEASWLRLACFVDMRTLERHVAEASNTAVSQQPSNAAEVAGGPSRPPRAAGAVAAGAIPTGAIAAGAIAAGAIATGAIATGAETTVCGAAADRGHPRQPKASRYGEGAATGPDAQGPARRGGHRPNVALGGVRAAPITELQGHAPRSPRPEGQAPPWPCPEGQAPPWPRSEVQEPPSLRPEVQEPPSLRPEGQAPPWPRSEVQEPPSLRPEGQAPPWPRSEVQEPPSLRPEGQAPPWPRTEGQGPPWQGTDGRAPRSQGAEGRERAPLHARAQWTSTGSVRVTFELSARAWRLVARSLEAARCRAGAPLRDGEALEAVARDALAMHQREPAPSHPRRPITVPENERCAKEPALDLHLNRDADRDRKVSLDTAGGTRGPLPEALRRAVMHRDHSRCRFPGCCRRRYVGVHRLGSRTEGGENSPGKCIVLCSAHQRLLNEGSLEISGDPDGELTFSHPVSCLRFGTVGGSEPRPDVSSAPSGAELGSAPVTEGDANRATPEVTAARHPLPSDTLASDVMASEAIHGERTVSEALASEALASDVSASGAHVSDEVAVCEALAGDVMASEAPIGDRRVSNALVGDPARSAFDGLGAARRCGAEHRGAEGAAGPREMGTSKPAHPSPCVVSEARASRALESPGRHADGCAPMAGPAEPGGSLGGGTCRSNVRSGEEGFESGGTTTQLGSSFTEAEVMSGHATRLVQTMGRRGGWSLDELIEQSGLTAHLVLAGMLELELRRRVRSPDGFYYDLR